MALDPPSDVVLEVAKAADPARAAMAAQRLNALAAAAGQGGFGETLSATAPASAPAMGGLANARSALSDPVDAAGKKEAKAEVDFEAMMLGSFVKEMMPKEATATFGQGLAGDMWKSMMADQLAHQIAKSGALGISRRLFAAHPLSAGASLERPTRAASEQAHDATQMSANSVSLPSSAVVEQGSYLSAEHKRT
ncbi:MAG: rod-binding protein [Hyphomicrobiales bacterium]|nr:rod-binding protein [Hyphomicrobiales bacterium]